jgi:hypothetical protein
MRLLTAVVPLTSGQRDEEACAAGDELNSWLEISRVFRGCFCEMLQQRAEP